MTQELQGLITSVNDNGTLLLNTALKIAQQVTGTTCSTYSQMFSIWGTPSSLP